MNIELIDQVIESIENEEIAGFDMRDVIRDDNRHPCGTFACIFGHYIMIKYDVKNEDEWIDRATGHIEPVPSSTDPSVHEDFGLNQSQINELFFGFTSLNTDLRHISKDEAIEALQDVKQGKFTVWSDYV